LTLSIYASVLAFVVSVLLKGVLPRQRHRNRCAAPFLPFANVRFSGLEEKAMQRFLPEGFFDRAVFTC